MGLTGVKIVRDIHRCASIAASVYLGRRICSTRRDLDVVEFSMDLSAQLHETSYFTTHVSIATVGHSQT